MTAAYDHTHEWVTSNLTDLTDPEDLNPSSPTYGQRTGRYEHRERCDCGAYRVTYARHRHAWRLLNTKNDCHTFRLSWGCMSGCGGTMEEERFRLPGTGDWNANAQPRICAVCRAMAEAAGLTV